MRVKILTATIKRKNARDFHVSEKSDAQVTEHIKNNPMLVPPNTQIILHGQYSKPDGKKSGPPHVHLGISDANRYGGDIIITKESIKSEKGAGGPGNYKDTTRIKRDEDLKSTTSSK